MGGGHNGLVAAFLFPDRRPELYQASPANVSVAGVPLPKIGAPLSVAAMVFLVYDAIAYPPLAIGSVKNWWQVPVYMIVVAAIAVIIFYGACFMRSRPGSPLGRDVDLIYRELPPE